MILRNGAHQAFNHRDPNYTERIKACTGPGGVDIIIEMLSNVNLDADLQLLSCAGRVMVVGCRGRIEINPRDTMSKESSIIGVSLFLATESGVVAAPVSRSPTPAPPSWSLWPVPGPSVPERQAAAGGGPAKGRRGE